MVATAIAESKLPIIATKQAIQSIRAITNDGKFTYYQSAQGKLFLASDFDVTTLMEDVANTNYLVFVSSAKKRVLISKDVAFHSVLGGRKLLEIYSSELGTKTIELIGTGISPTLHLNDTWASFYDPHTNSIYFKNIENRQTNFKIDLFNKTNIFFIPQVIMINNNEIVYTDINQSGLEGVMFFKRNEKKAEIKIKATNIMQHFELCISSSLDNLFIGRFNHDKNDTLSIIQRAKLKDNTFPLDTIQTIYESKLDDRGNINCTFSNDKLFFIKAINNGGKHLFEATSLNLKNSSVTIESDLGQVTQLIEMDKKILIPHNGEYYLLVGENNLGEELLGRPEEREKNDEKEGHKKIISGKEKKK